MPRVVFFVLLLALSVTAFAYENPAREQSYRNSLGFYATHAGDVILQNEARGGWRESQSASFGVGSVLFLGSAVGMLIGIPEGRRAERLFQELSERQGTAHSETYRQLYQALAEDERRERKQQSILSMVLGASLLTGGLIANASSESAPFLSMLGAGALGGSFLNFVLPGYYGARAAAYAIARDPAPSFQFGVSSLLGRGGRISAAILF